MTLTAFLRKMTLPVTLAASGLMMSASLVSAAVVTIDEAGLESVFYQASFGTSPIDIRLSPVEKVVAPDLLKITTKRESHALLYDMATGTSAINIYFVDELDYCGGYNVRIVGCGAIRNPGVIVESDFAESIYGTELLAHEMSHNLGVVAHEPGLLSAALDGDLALTAVQAAKILTSPLVQSDPLGLFLTVNPILIIARAEATTSTSPSVSTIPLPAGGWLLLEGLGCLAAARSRRKAA